MSTSRTASDNSFASTSKTFTRRKHNDPGALPEEIVGRLGLTTLHSPVRAAIAHLVFVHGLNGGSRKTWTNDSDASSFWPKEWLHRDPDFHDVGIHTFGYDSSWTKGSVLDVGDFATSLLEWILDCPELSLDPGTPLIFICHSMGGLVAKQAYILSRELPEYELVGASLHSIFFLATPHRGSDLAETLSRILRVSPGPRPFVGDLHPHSEAIQSMNDKFPRLSGNLRLHSFYETEPMHFGIKKSLVVRKESAVLGYPNERATYLNANHRHVCKFDSPDSSNYRAVRNALAATVNSYRASAVLDRRTSFPEQQQMINRTLGVHDRPEDDFLRIESLKIRGSCEWIKQRPAFQSWSQEEPPYVYFVTAKPGAGKSVLCGHVLRLLRDANHKCSFFFFSHADKQKSSLSAFLRSMAWQLATNLEMLTHMASVCKHESQLSTADDRTIWRKLFIECIFKQRPGRPQYWIIDALDECENDRELTHYLMQAAATGHFRIFVTSRTSLAHYGPAESPQTTLYMDKISEQTTNMDIELYLRENTEYLPTRDRNYTAQMILDKSEGCFLWTRLVLEELRQGLTRAGIHRILDDVPSGMDNLYNRIIQVMFDKAREKTMITAILEWTTCAMRPLTTEELHHALKLDMNDEIDGDIKRFVESNCGQLVVVDNSGRVRMVHLTARDFLFSKNNAVYQLDRAEGHKRLAMVCLKYLMGAGRATNRSRKLNIGNTATSQDAFMPYAANALFKHISFVNSEDDGFATGLHRFLKSATVVSWIEYMAHNSDLSRLVQAGLALRRYTARRKQNTLPFGNAGEENALFETWATDMIRLVTKFGSHLQGSSTSVTKLIAPFCPVESAIHSQFATSNQAIKVRGIASASWDDCASTIVLEAAPLTVASAMGLFAVGLQSGMIVIYEERTCQELKSLDHGEPVRKLLFGRIDSNIIAASLSKVSIWSAGIWTQQWSQTLDTRIISLALTDDEKLLMATCRSNEIYWWETDTGVQHEPESWLDEAMDEQERMFRRPYTTALSADQMFLAVAYRGEDVTLWDIERMIDCDVFGKNEGSLGPAATPRKGVSSVRSMIFSKARGEARLLVASYNDGDMVLFNTEQGSVQASIPANAQILVSSNDGLLLACGDSGGEIQLYEFDTLKLLYRIQGDQTTVNNLAFSADDQRLLGVQSRHCYVWDPPVLVRQHHLEEEGSDTVSVSTGLQEVKVTESRQIIDITSMTTADGGRFAFCGKEDGSVGLYDTAEGRQTSELHRHAKNIAIVEIVFSQSSYTLATRDVSSRIMVHLVIADLTRGYVLGRCIWDRRVGTAVTQMLIGPDAHHLLVSTEQNDLLLSLRPGELVDICKPASPPRRHHWWCTNAQRPYELIIVAADFAHIYSWRDLARITGESGIHLAGTPDPSLKHLFAQPCFDETHIALTYSESFKPHSRRKILFYSINDFTPDTTTVQPLPDLSELADHVHALIGNTYTGASHAQRLAFLHRNGWVCSASGASSFNLDLYDQHYPLPADWLSSLTRMQMEISAKGGTLLFVKRADLISVARGLEYTEGGRSRLRMKRPTMKPASLSHDSILEDRETEDSVGHRRHRNLAERLRWTKTSSSQDTADMHLKM